MDQTATNQFRTALTYLLDQEGRGAQARLADLLGIDRGYLSAIIRGRKPGSEAKRCQIAAHFGMVYEDMLILGRRILNGEDDPSRRGQEGKIPLSKESVDVDAENERVIDFKIPPITGSGSKNVSEKIINFLQMLDSDSAYSMVLDGLLDIYQDNVRTKQKNSDLEEELRGLKKENFEMKSQLKELESRLDRLESRSDGEEEILRKTA